MEHVSHSMEFSLPGVHMGMVPNMSNNHESHHFSLSVDQMGLVEPMSYGSEFNTIMVANNSSGNNQSMGGSMSSSPFWISNQPGLDAPPLNSSEGHARLFPPKRKAALQHAFIRSVSQQSRFNDYPENLIADSGSIRSVQSSESQRKTGPVQPNSGFPGSQTHSASSKRKMSNEPIGKSGLPRGRPAKKQTAQIDSATKSRSGSSDVLRSKMKESLADALALAFKKPSELSTAKKDKSENAITHQMPVQSQPSESNTSMDGNVHHSVNEEVVPSQGSSVVSTTNNSLALSSEIPSKISNFSGGEASQEFQFNSIFPDGDVQFTDNLFVKDDLLLGNGLSWAFRSNAQMGEGNEGQNADKPPYVAEEANFHGSRDKAEVLTPDNLASKIEAELFKLFGGTNKKYKEKGRSLLFNLKDQKNPELRESVMSGKISPERLCSMSAEELASKELSEWRIAKAEEMAQMVVLPDIEVDMRRLVRKTHKGEYQVEFEHDDGIADEVSSGSSVLVQRLPKKDIETTPPKPSRKGEENVAGQEKTSENQDFPGSLIIPTDGDGTDLMQGMMVDEFKDATSLPPIVSLDEFMESLNAEPPFENLSEDQVHKSPLAHEVSPNVASNTLTSGRASISPIDASSRKTDVVKKTSDMTTKSSGSGQKSMTIKSSGSGKKDMTMKSSGSGKKDKTMKSSGSGQKVPSSSVLEVDSVWEGILQLSMSSLVTVRGLFQSGEKTSTKEWSTSLEIKGRVRLDAFEKFLLELPKSRTRALMIIQFVLKDKSSENQLSILSEAITSYTSDERLGYAEPARGVELYVCPPTPRIAELLKKHMPKDSESDSSLGNGLIGVVVWRRASISPNASSNHAHSIKKQPFSSSSIRPQDSSNVNSPTRAPVFSRSKPVPAPEPEEDDIPPGFGPGAAKDEDDLPEFNFSGGFNSSGSRLSSQDVKMTATPVDHVRELIKKYGQSDEKIGLSVEPWDDDDDIPEWRPEASGQPFPAALRPVSQHVAAPVNRQPPPGGRWPGAQPHQHTYGARWRQQ